ncbi:MAG: homoserine kinase [Bacteroidales bacterium]|nr:homoserine kinase [Bacteroidales bacterium]
MTNYKSVTAFAPASVANVGCGFDIMGFAVQGIGDTVTVTLQPDSDNSEITLTGTYGHLTPTERSKNTAGVAINAYLQAIGKSDIGLNITLQKNMPLGSGMGSSAASSAAAVYAVNHLLGSPLSTKELIPFTMEGERVACGSAHADNVAPALLGGFVLIRSYDPLDIISVKGPDDLFAAVVHPHIELNTSDSRRVLNKEVSVADAIIQSANTAGFMVALIKSDYELMKRSMSDLLAEPRRTQLIPGYDAIKNAAMEAGAIGCGIAGSGPSIFALCKGETTAKQVAKIIRDGFTNIGLFNEGYVSQLNAPGTVIIDSVE